MSTAGRRWTPGEIDTALMLLATNKDWRAYDAVLLEMIRPVVKHYHRHATHEASEAAMLTLAAREAVQRWRLSQWRPQSLEQA